MGRKYFIKKARQVIEAAFGIELKRAQTCNAKLWDALLKTREIDEHSTEEDASFLRFCKAHLGSSKAQLCQDLFVLCRLANKRKGFFVEFGATDGVSLSNTFLLETDYDWNGIVVEPARAWHAELKKNRRCTIDYRCVAGASGNKIMFNETEWLELSTIEEFSSRGRNAEARILRNRYEVTSVSLTDLLRDHNAPNHFDYLSVDTEGSELAILEAFDFSQYTPQVITVEHNFDETNRRGLYALLSHRGYTREFAELSKFDDWYVLKTI
jgi:FkbM family methyltransferase